MTESVNNRSWWGDWGDTEKVEECLNPTPIDPEDPPLAVEDTNKYCPLICDFLIFDSNVLTTYFQEL